MTGPVACVRPSTECCRSSVVEHSLGKGEVVGSIPPGSTSFHALLNGCPHRSRARRGSPAFGKISPRADCVRASLPAIEIAPPRYLDPPCALRFRAAHRRCYGG